MKRFIMVVLLLVSVACAFAADKYAHLGGNSLANELQWLAIQTACIGQYNMAQTGDYSIGDPHDYYTPADIREYLTRQSVQAHGSATNHAWLWVYGNDGTIYCAAQDLQGPPPRKSGQPRNGRVPHRRSRIHGGDGLP